MTTYKHLMIDPPWPKNKGGRRKVRPNQNSHLDYSTMSVENIFSLVDKDIMPLVDQTGHNIFLWVVEEFLPEAEIEMKKRGYKLHVRLIWDKMNGIAPAFTIRYCHEYLLWFYTPSKMPKVDKDQRGKFTSVITEKSRQHSRKPNKAYDMIEALYPNSNKIDVFSREKRLGWDQYGDQPEHFRK